MLKKQQNKGENRMTFIKSIKMHGFKSFAKATEIVFDKDLSIIVGPNGSGKSNITEAICFVLGRLSAKSMRAEKSANLIYNGGKNQRSADEAKVEMTFDNSSGVFPIEGDIKIERIVRQDGNSIYKINSKTKTRQEVQELLGHANIDSKGFNIILQEEITQFIEMHPEDRRRIIEEIAGIRIYEERKEKSQHELERTEEKLKEVSIILGQRRAYLKNLEQEKTEALKYRKYEEAVKKCRATLLHKNIENKNDELDNLEKQISDKSKLVENKKSELKKIKESADKLREEIQRINVSIQQSSGIQQENLSNEIISLKEQIASLSVRKENYDTKIGESEKRKLQLESSIAEYEEQIEALKKTKPKSKVKTRENIEEKRKELENLEKEKADFYRARQKHSEIKNNLQNKKDVLQRIKSQSEFIINQIESSSSQLSELTEDLDGVNKKLNDMRDKHSKSKDDLEKTQDSIITIEKDMSKKEVEIVRQQKIKNDVSKLDICPLCKTKITSGHVSHVIEEANRISDECEKSVDNLKEKLESLRKKNSAIKEDIERQSGLIRKKEYDLTHINNILAQKERLRELEKDEDKLAEEAKELEKENKRIEAHLGKFDGIDEKYDDIKLKIQELSEIGEEDRDAQLSLRTLELENTKNAIKRILREQEEISTSLEEYSAELDGKQAILEEKEGQDKILKEKFNSLYNKKAGIQDSIVELDKEQIRIDGEMKQEENISNDLRIDKARINADREIMEKEFEPFKNTELIKGNRESVQERLKNAEEALIRIGSVNMRALEVYEDIKNQYDEVDEKVKKLEEEKQEILMIIMEIDAKKKKSFIKVFNTINERFTNNFSKLIFNKGPAFLELENKENPFEGGIDVNVRIAKGKYLDVNSLSGGERTLAALSLIFAIQEYKPHYFYIFDEIDAALDKRNSEKLSQLIVNSIGKAQYIIISHNDHVMSEAKTLYGVSMQEGVSKILSLKI